MQDTCYVSGMLKDKLEREYCNPRLLKNPRISEVAEIVIEYAKKMGIVGEPNNPLYHSRMQERIHMLLYQSPGFLTVTRDANVRMELPTYYGEDEVYQETRTYEMMQNLQMKRIIEKSSNYQKEWIESNMDKDGIEIQRKIYRNGDLEPNVIIQRMQEYPQIMVETRSDGNKKYYSLAEASRWENLNKEEAKPITEEEIMPMSKVEKIRIAEKNKYTAYSNGSRKLLQLSPDRDDSGRE